MIGHLGARVSALLDGQLSAADEERAWEHVHSCYQCRDAVEREGWVKTRLATMHLAGAPAPSHLKGSLLLSAMTEWGAEWAGDRHEEWGGWPADADHPALTGPASRRRHLGLGGIGGGAVGAAVMGVLALGASPANAPGSVLQPGGDTFGTTLSHVVTTVVDGDPSPSSRGGSRLKAPAGVGGHRRTLAP